MVRKILLTLCALILIVFVVAAIYLAEASLHLHRRELSNRDIERATTMAERFKRSLMSAELLRSDTILRAWYFHGSKSHRVVMLFHGQGDNRAGMIPYAEMFLRNDFDVLAPDSRAHGLSGDAISTYGIREVDDLSGWIDWLQERNPSVQVFGLGESMGAAILLQSVRKENRWKGIVAESSFSDFRTIAAERLSQKIPLPSSLLVDTAITYARLRYGLEFNAVSPVEAVSRTAIPVLLIHGTLDKNINPNHSTRIAAMNPSLALWPVANTAHTAAFGTHPKEFEKRVLAHFADSK